MRSSTDTRALASMNLPGGFSFFVNADHAELVTSEGGVVRFGEGYTVAEVEAVAFERAGEIVSRTPPDFHHLINEALDATGWDAEKRELFMMDFLYAFCVEAEEMNRLDEEWRDGTDGEDDAKAGWTR